MTPYKIRKEVLIDAPINKVWNALTNPKLIKEYMFGSDVNSDWSPGSEIVFSGEHQGVRYTDRGTITTFEIEQELEYTFLSSFSGLEDKPENYSKVNLKVCGMDDGETTLTVCQENLPSKEASIHADSGWDHSLEKLKVLVEG